MNYQDHKKYAENLLAQAQEPDNESHRDTLIAEAQVHATLALAVATWQPPR